MDAPEFVMLSSEAREERIYRWNKLRKIRPTARAASDEDSSPSVPELEPQPPEPVPSGYEIELEDLAVPSPPPAPDFAAELVPPSAGDANLESGRQNALSAVLGRISLVRERRRRTPPRASGEAARVTSRRFHEQVDRAFAGLCCWRLAYGSVTPMDVGWRIASRSGRGEAGQGETES
jgi:hypothetical protein